jgi:predicted Zn-dependent protease
MWSSGCHAVPHTGRSALHLVPTKQLASMASIQFEQPKRETPISRDANYKAMLRRVAEHIALCGCAKHAQCAVGIRRL